MPIHDWTRVPPGLFHNFHQSWTVEIANALNQGRLSPRMSALIQHPSMIGGDPASVIVDTTLRQSVGRTDREHYAARANRIVIMHRLRRPVALIEIVSPGNKDSRAGFRDFVGKTVELLLAGIHVLVVDLFPPTARDPQGIHKAIWDEFEEGSFELPADKPLTLAAYVAGVPKTAYVEPVRVGGALPDMPAFLSADSYVAVPLEATYQATWASCPQDFRDAVENGLPPSDESGE